MILTVDRARSLAPGPWVKILESSELSMDDYIAQDDEDEDTGAPRYQYYYSKKLLGKLYRRVQEHKIWNEDIKQPVPGSHSFWGNLIHNFQERINVIGKTDWRCRRQEADNLRHVYVSHTLTFCVTH
jgi:hypothetical protein